MAWRRLQSHAGKVRQKPDSGTAYQYARRSLLRAAVFGAPDHDPAPPGPAVARSVTAGLLTEAREDVIVIETGHGAELFAVSTDTVTWRGGRVPVSGLRPGDPLVIRHQDPGGGPPGRRVAERVWARAGRVTGTIVEAGDSEFVVDVASGGPQRVVMAPAASRQIQVRFPRLAPGYLVDFIGLRQPGYLEAVVPATAQPPYHAADSPGPPRVSGPVAMPASGSAVWHEPGAEPPGLLGLGYPAIDPAAGGRGAGGHGAGGHGAGCVRLPYLSLGSVVRVRNECAGRAALLPVTSEGVMARQFCDRCVRCGTSPKGRVADLTVTAFVELGGNLEDGCFNATLATMSLLHGGNQ